MAVSGVITVSGQPVSGIADRPRVPFLLSGAAATLNSGTYTLTDYSRLGSNERDRMFVHMYKYVLFHTTYETCCADPGFDPVLENAVIQRGLDDSNWHQRKNLRFTREQSEANYRSWRTGILNASGVVVGGIIWFAIVSGTPASGVGIVPLSAHFWPGFAPSFTLSGRAKATFDAIEFFLNTPLSGSDGLVYQLASAQTLFFSDTVRNEAADFYLQIFHAELVARASRSSNPIHFMEVADLTLSGRTLITITL